MFKLESDDAFEHVEIGNKRSEDDRIWGITVESSDFRV